MTRFMRFTLPCAVLGLATSLVLPVSAATGISYNSVTKFSAGAEDTPAAPGTYRVDFETASSTSASSGNTPHVPFGLGKMIGKMNSALSALKTGTAEKHYVGITKERVDEVAAKTATITD